MAIAKDILSGLFGATAGGLRGYAVQQAEERERMRREREILSERDFQREMESTRAEREREREQRRRDEERQREIRERILAGQIVQESESPLERVGAETPRGGAEILQEAVAPIVPDATPTADLLSFRPPETDAPSGLRFRPEQPVDLGADFQLQPRTRPERGLMGFGDDVFSIVSPVEQAARRLEAQRGGLDSIEIQRLRDDARRGDKSAQIALADMDMDYLTQEEIREEEREFILGRDKTRRQEELEDRAADQERDELKRLQDSLSALIRTQITAGAGVMPNEAQVADMVGSLVQGTSLLGTLLNNLSNEDLESVTSGAVQDVALEVEQSSAVSDDFPGVAERKAKQDERLQQGEAEAQQRDRDQMIVNTLGQYVVTPQSLDPSLFLAPRLSRDTPDDIRERLAIYTPEDEQEVIREYSNALRRLGAGR